MSDEIKEMLDIIKKVSVREENSRNGLMQKDSNKYKQLLDYITNLQEENQKLIELCDKYEEEHNTTFQEWLKELKEGNK